MRTAYKTLIILVTAATVTVIALWRLEWHHEEPQMPDHLTCVLNVSRRIANTDGYVAGYNYELLHRFAEDHGCTVEIMVAGRGENCIDSLAAGVYDIVVESLSDRQLPDSLATTATVDSLALWIVSPRLKDIVPIMDRWLVEYYSSELYESMHKAFTDEIGNPHYALARGEKREHLSPYDSLIRHYSAEIGWDWRLLAAMIWQESHFHIEVLSYRGAAGLMQITPPTANRYELENLLDPEENIRTGVHHLKGLQRIFRRRSANREELRKITLAAYNAGPGHIKDAFNYANELGVNNGSWDSLKVVLPHLADSETVARTDTIKHGTFKVSETIGYVDNIMEMYEIFKQICREEQ